MSRRILKLLSAMALLVVISGCSLPRIIVLNDPLTPRQHNDLGVAYEQAGETELALRSYRRAAKGDRCWAQPLVNTGNVLAAGGDWKGAVTSFRAALRREAQHVEAMNNLAWSLLQQGELAEARRWAEAALQQQPDEVLFLDTLAEIQLAQGDAAAAGATLLRALQQPLPDAERRRLLQRLEEVTGAMGGAVGDETP